MNSKKIFIFALLFVFMIINAAYPSGPSVLDDGTTAIESSQPKLVVQITIDQLRGDMPMRFKDRLGEGGFKYLLRGTFSPTPLNRKILNNFHPKRSGSVHVIAEQFWYIAYEMDDVTEIAAIHASPWKYDTYVPIFFAGHGVPAQRIARPVTPYDIAATLAVYLEIKPPSGSVGTPLLEVLKAK